MVRPAGVDGEIRHLRGRRTTHYSQKQDKALKPEMP
jgi:hypothetical protein